MTPPWKISGIAWMIRGFERCAPNPESSDSFDPSRIFQDFLRQPQSPTMDDLLNASLVKDSSRRRIMECDGIDSALAEREDSVVLEHSKNRLRLRGGVSRGNRSFVGAAWSVSEPKRRRCRRTPCIHDSDSIRRRFRDHISGSPNSGKRNKPEMVPSTRFRVTFGETGDSAMTGLS